MTRPPETVLHVNGTPRSLEVDPGIALILALRNELGLKGVRAGCGEGFCGSCTVLHDGIPIRSCTTSLEAVAGGRITTPEGLGDQARPHAVQAAFIEEQAAQCGYCINGIIMTTAAAVDGRRDLTPAQLAQDHLCRCGTHGRILRAVARCTTGAGHDEPTVAHAAAGVTHDAAGVTHDAAGVTHAAAGVGPAVADHLASATLEPLSLDRGQVEAWLQLMPDGRIAALSGKVELGQGVRTALAQIVAAQLGIGADRVVVVPTRTALSADEKYTAGSNSVDLGGALLGRAAVAFGRHLRLRAAECLGVDDGAHLEVTAAGDIRCGDRSIDFAELAALGPVVGAITEDDVVDWRRLAPATSVPRGDLLAKLTGAAAFIHDITVPGMVHARALLPPAYDAELVELDTRAAASLPGVIDVIVDGRLVVVLADREEHVRRAVVRLARDARWQVPDGGVDALQLVDHLRSLPSEPFVAAASDVAGRGAASHRASYSLPYQAHASIAPSCALASLDEQGHLEVLTHSQGVYPLRDSLAALLERDPEAITVQHRDGPGCYGHNLADDAAAFAAIAALAVPGRTVRFLFSMEDEFTWEPYGSAMVLDLEATVEADGRIAAWRHRAITGMHSNRPRGGAEQLAPSWLRSNARERPRSRPFEGGARDAVPIYDVPAIDAVADHVDGPLRTSSLRTLGSFGNTFAAESFLDELAQRAGRDPIGYRLEHLSDERARRVLEVVSEAVAWCEKVGPTGEGRGVALGRYKGEKAYVAAVAQVGVDLESMRIRVRKLTLACDAGTVVNPDGLANQLEGGALQAVSRLLHEQVDFDRHGVTSRDWSTYRVLGFDEVPEVELHVLDSSAPPLGAGEAALGPVAAAIANAVDDAIGVRLRELPLTPKRVTDRLFALDDEESARVLLA